MRFSLTMYGLNRCFFRTTYTQATATAIGRYVIYRWFAEILHNCVLNLDEQLCDMVFDDSRKLPPQLGLGRSLLCKHYFSNFMVMKKTFRDSNFDIILNDRSARKRHGQQFLGGPINCVGPLLANWFRRNPAGYTRPPMHDRRLCMARARLSLRN